MMTDRWTGFLFIVAQVSGAPDAFRYVIFCRVSSDKSGSNYWSNNERI